VLRVHGIQREVFGVRLMHNSHALLKGSLESPLWRTEDVGATTEHWKTRWGHPRQLRSGTPSFDPNSWRLWPA
jgi:hypothetical protein